MFSRIQKKKPFYFQVQKFNVMFELRNESNGEFKLYCNKSDFLADLLEVFWVFQFEDHMEFVDRVKNKQDFSYQDFSIFFEDNAVTYYLGAPAGQVSEPVFFEVLTYFLTTIKSMEKANEIFEKHLADFVEANGIRTNMDIITAAMSKYVNN